MVPSMGKQDVTCCHMLWRLATCKSSLCPQLDFYSLKVATKQKHKSLYSASQNRANTIRKTQVGDSRKGKFMGSWGESWENHLRTAAHTSFLACPAVILGQSPGTYKGPVVWTSKCPLRQGLVKTITVSLGEPDNRPCVSLILWQSYKILLLLLYIIILRWRNWARGYPLNVLAVRIWTWVCPSQKPVLLFSFLHSASLV